MFAVFLYGSLLDERLRKAVFADSVSNKQIINATARDVVTMRYPGESFPVLLPKVGECVNGALLIDPNEEARKRMAFYEGDEYEIDTLYVDVNGQQVKAQYNRALEIEGITFDEPWCYEAWLNKESEDLVAIATDYMDLCWGKMNATEADVVWQALVAEKARKKRLGRFSAPTSALADTIAIL